MAPPTRLGLVQWAKVPKTPTISPVAPQACNGSPRLNSRGHMSLHTGPLVRHSRPGASLLLGPQPPPQQRRIVSHDDRGCPSSSGVTAIKGLLAKIINTRRPS